MVLSLLVFILFHLLALGIENYCSRNQPTSVLDVYLLNVVPFDQTQISKITFNLGKN